VVDITNLVMLETGQPLHAYDRLRLPVGDGRGFGVRIGREGENLQTLDDQPRGLGPDQLLITHGDEPVALAGVIGGLPSAVTDDTTEVVLEAAVFPAAAVRRSARGLGLRTEASSRFERGVAAAATLAAADRAVALLQELCGARVVDRRWSGEAPGSPSPVSLRREALDRLLGPLPSDDDAFAAIPDGTVVATLERLGCVVSADDEGWRVTPPPSRGQDLQREVDLIEEVARLIGYDRFALHLPDPVEPGGLEPSQAVLRRLRAALRGQGLQELCHLSLVPTDSERTDQVCLHNPLLAETSALRQALLPALLQAAVRNRQASRPGFWGFEIGHCFVQTPEGPRQELRLAGVLAGERRSERWTSSGHDRQPDYWQARGLLAAALAEVGLIVQDRRLTDDALLHPGRAAALFLEGRPVGRFGALHPAEADRLDLTGETHVFDLAVEPLLAAATRPTRLIPAFVPYPVVPASERDLAFVVGTDVEAAAVTQQLAKAGGSLLEAVELLDRYTGNPVPDGFCSLAVRLRFRDPSATLTDEQVEPVMEKLRRMLVQRFSAELRS
jgi:phenylalanyl-tRNA synthetase beta chain